MASGSPTIIPTPVQPTGNFSPVASCRAFAHRERITVAAMPATSAIRMTIEPSANTGAGIRAPRLLRYKVSAMEMLSRTRGSASRITHQKMICSSNGTLRVNST